MSSFENRIWAELAERYGGELAQAAPHGRPSPRRRRNRLVIAGATVLLAAAIAVTLSGTLKAPNPAYAVRLNHDGTVTLRLDALAAASAANERLAGLGIRARVVLAESGCSLRGDTTASFPRGSRPDERLRAEAILRAENLVLQSLVRSLQSRRRTRSHGLEVRIRPNAIPRGYVVVMNVRNIRANRSHAIGMRVQLLKGPAPRCPPTG